MSAVAALIALRPHQWAKNLLVLAPLVAGHGYTRPEAWLAGGQIFAAWCLAASAGYLLNDWSDRDADRAHPRKRLRPVASGALSATAALLLSALLALGALALAATQGPLVLACLGVYLVLTAGYSRWLKRLPMVDLFVLAALYCLRLLGGGLATGYPPSGWLLACGVFLFVALAALKRCGELVSVPPASDGALPGRGYRFGDLPLLMALGIACSVQAGTVLALYLTRAETARLYAHPDWLWLLLPIVLLWQARLWLAAWRGIMHDDPVAHALMDIPGILLVVAGFVVVVVSA